MNLLSFINLSAGSKWTMLLMSIISAFTPLKVIAAAVLVFILIDFVFGWRVSYKVKKRGFLSSEGWKTVWKFVGAEVAIGLAYILDVHVLTFIPTLFLANILAAIICGSELWSIVTNFAILSDHPVFKLIKKWGRHEIEHKLGFDISELDNNNEKNNN